MSSTSRSHRSSISPFRSRKSPAPPPPASGGTRQTTPLTGSSRPPSKPPVSSNLTYDQADASVDKENVTVTVRFRPLSGREINKGDEIAWYADGDHTVRNEYNSSTAYGFDRVFGPATTTRHVYDVAAQHVVSGSMEGINGTVFAYGVTSSGKTHTMHGEQKSPGIIPLAVKDVFGIIQETPGREFLLRVSYLEIYNEVINDLLDLTGQNLKIREDAQGTYVEAIKEEVVLSPAHALSLIASGEEHRHVGSNNFNLLSSRSHTIFTLTIESSSRGENQSEDVTLSQLHLIDLAGSESSKTGTTGLRRKEGSYINKSLLTLGTVISKLTDRKSSHIPFRDSKLTRLLQSSLSGHGRVSLICTVTPASSNNEETHNTLKFAHRSKHVEIKVSQNKILDEKSLIKKYQREISTLKQELQQLKQGIVENPNMMESKNEDLINLKLQFEAGQVKLQSRLEEEEQDKAALLGRIQRLTKLILVSTKSTMSTNIPTKAGNRRRHSFGEDELAYLPDRKRECTVDDDVGSVDSADGGGDFSSLDDLGSDYKRNRRRGMLGWFKIKKAENLSGSSPKAGNESSTTDSPASSSKSSRNQVMFSDIKDGQRTSVSRGGHDHSGIESLPQRNQAGDLFTATVGGRRLPPSGTTITDQMDLLREQVKMLAGEVALCTSSLKRLSEHAANNPKDSKLQEQMNTLKDDIEEKKVQMAILEQRMIAPVEMTSRTSNSVEMSQAFSKLAIQLNQKSFELEIKSADNRILQEQLQMKISENAEMQETILLLRQQLDLLLSEKSSSKPQQYVVSEGTDLDSYSGECLEKKNDSKAGVHVCEETSLDQYTPTSVMSLNRVFSQEDSKECNHDTSLNSQLLMQAAEIETLKQEKVKMTRQKDELETHSLKLAEEGSYAKELAAAAAVELRNLAEEVTKLSYQNAKLSADLATAEEASSISNHGNGVRTSGRTRKSDDGVLVGELRQEINSRFQREASLVAALSERDQIEGVLRKRLDEAKQNEEDMESELANVWALVAKMNKSGINTEQMSEGVYTSNILQTRVRNGFHLSDDNRDEISTSEDLKASYANERKRC